MKTEQIDISKLRIASPCSVHWDTMKGDERTRHCDLCELNVYNVAGMTEKGVRELIERAEGRVCMRLMRRADGSVITRDCPVGIRGYRKRVASYAGAAMATVLGLFSLSYEQKKDPTPAAPEIKIVQTDDKRVARRITGTVTDPNGGVVPGAEIVLLSGSDQKARVRSDSEGMFVIDRIENGEYSIQITSAGFKLFALERLVVKHGQYLKFDAILYPKLDELVGLLGVTEDSLVDLGDSSSLIPSVKDITPRKKP